MGGYSPSFAPDSSRILDDLSKNPGMNGPYSSEVGPPRGPSWMERNTPKSKFVAPTVTQEMKDALLTVGRALSGSLSPGATQLTYPPDPSGRSFGDLLNTDWNPGGGGGAPGPAADVATSTAAAPKAPARRGGGKPVRTVLDAGADTRDIAARGRPEQDDMSEELKALIGRIEGKKEFDLTPLLALTDTWTGSNLSRNYQRPMSDDERDKEVVGLKNKLVERHETMQAKRDYLAQMAKQERDRLQDKQDNRDLQIQLHNMDNSTRLAVEGQKQTGKADGEAKKIPDKLKKDYGTALNEIAKKRVFDPKNPYAKNKGNPQEVHEEALAMAQAAVDQGLTDNLQHAYGKYISIAMAKPNGFVTGD